MIICCDFCHLCCYGFMASFFIQLKVAQVLLSRLFLSGKSRCPCRFSCIICGCLCVSYISVVRDIWHFQIWLTFLSFCCCLYISLTFNSFTVEERNTAVIARYSFKCCIVRVYLCTHGCMYRTFYLFHAVFILSSWSCCNYMDIRDTV